MEDFDEAEEQNEEDLLELGDTFANINLKVKSYFANHLYLESCFGDTE
jgi:hypothetical protein